MAVDDRRGARRTALKDEERILRATRPVVLERDCLVIVNLGLESLVCWRLWLYSDSNDNSAGNERLGNANEEKRERERESELQLKRGQCKVGAS